MHTRVLFHLLAAKVAVLSAKEQSPNLIPVLLYGGSSGEASAAAHENILWFRDQGGIVYHHNLTFMSNLQVSKLAARHAYCKTRPGQKDLQRPHTTPSMHVLLVHAYTTAFWLHILLTRLLHQITCPTISESVLSFSTFSAAIVSDGRRMLPYIEPAVMPQELRRELWCIV